MNIKKLLSPYVICCLIIITFNVAIRLYFVNYGYITIDEGISFINNKLAYSGLIPFINYNGWNSLINDYLSGLPRLFTQTNFIYQRLYALIIAIIILIISLKISYNFNKSIAPVITVFLLTFGSVFYLYQSTIPYSEQFMTLFLMISLYFINKHSLNIVEIYRNDIIAIVFLAIATVVRSQMLPIYLIVLIYIFLEKKYSIFRKLVLVSYSILVIVILYLPFFIKSWQNALYGLIWPFFSHKILMYVYGVPQKNLSQYINFVIEVSRDYGIFISIILSSLVISLFDKKTDRIKLFHPFILLLLIISTLFILTGMIHHPVAASYIYPSVPILACISAYFISSYLSRCIIIIKYFTLFFFILITLNNFIMFPHFKMMNTSIHNLKSSPYQNLKIIDNYITNNTNLYDEIMSFDIPTIAQIDRKFPTRLNEGTASISLLNDELSSKFHLYNLNQINEIIVSKQAKVIVYTDNSIHYFGKTDNERDLMVKNIKTYYNLEKVFGVENIIGTKNMNLYIYIRKD